MNELSDGGKLRLILLVFLMAGIHFFNPPENHGWENPGLKEYFTATGATEGLAKTVIAKSYKMFGLKRPPGTNRNIFADLTDGERSAACPANYILVKDSNNVDAYCAPATKLITCPSPGVWNAVTKTCDHPEVKGEIDWIDDDFDPLINRPPTQILPANSIPVICPNDPATGLPSYQVGCNCVSAEKKCKEGYSWNAVEKKCVNDVKSKCTGDLRMSDGFGKAFCFK